jgi:hypothetical protein
VEGPHHAVQERRFLLPLLLTMVSVAASGAAFALRYDPAPAVLRDLSSKGDLGRYTEQEIADAVRLAGRTRLVGGVAKGLVVAPLCVLALAVSLSFLGWLFAVPATFSRCFSAAAIALTPIALYHVIFAACAVSHAGLTTDDLATLVPSSLASQVKVDGAVAKRALVALDFFHLWSAGLAGLAFSAASGMRRFRALLLGFLVYALFAGAVLMRVGAGGAP